VKKFIHIAALVLALAAPVLAKTHIVTVAGLGGEPDYEQRFASWAKELDKIFASSADTQVHTLIAPNSTKAKLQQTLQGIAGSAAQGDSLVVLLIGHGSFDGLEYKFNIPGPDLASVELAAFLDRVPIPKQLVVNMTSASGASVNALQKPGRTVITATRTGTEKNATLYARYFIEALRDAASDTDKNETITALEAFKFAETKTKQFYETQKRIATEHAALDGGDQQGAARAQQFALLRLGSTQLAAKDPAKRSLLAKREQIELQIDNLKFQKAAMPADTYRKQLSALLLELARIQEELDK
jgi:hypothetical protein